MGPLTQDINKELVMKTGKGLQGKSVRQCVGVRGTATGDLCFSLFLVHRFRPVPKELGVCRGRRGEGLCLIS